MIGWLATMATLAMAVALGAGPQTVISSLDLTHAFATRTPWRFVAMQGPEVADPVYDDQKAPGPITLCLAKADGGPCVQPVANLSDAYWDAHNLDDARIVRASGRAPLLWLRTSSLAGGNGDQAILYQALAYRRADDRFEQVYAHQTGHNNNQDVRLVEAGPLAGAVISAEPTQDAPFGFWIVVNRPGPNGRFAPILRYRSATRYGDGNPLAVIDSEMPNIQQRLGLWRPGQPLPLPSGPCPRPHLAKGSLWCR